MDSFDNDSALDWISLCDGTPNREFIVDTLSTAAESADKYLEIDECHYAIASAEFVAALKGAPSPQLPDELREHAALHMITPDQQLVNMALAAVDRVTTDGELSELRDLREEGTSPNLAEWLAAINDLKARLRQ
jgi:hypothetical protein